jgi:PKD repeat protein
VSVTVNDTTNNPPVAVATADPTHGHVPLTVTFDGSGSYDPDADLIVDYEWDLGDGDSAYGAQVSHTYTAEGEYTCTLYVFDEFGNVGSTDVLITVVLNTPPTASNSEVTTDEDVPAAVTLVASDADGDPLTYIILSQPSHGELSGTAPNLTYTPPANWSGTDGLTFKVSDGMDESGMATVTINVLPVNDAPVAEDVSVEAWVDRSVNVVLSASDVENDALTFAVVTDPAHGTISDLDPTAGTLLYTPDAGYVGDDSFTYVANDGLVDSNVATVTVEMAEIRIVSVSTGKPYSLGTAEADALYYIDRKYVIQEVDSPLDGQVLVRTANNDKYVRTENHLVLSVGRDVTLSVCYDKRVTVLPAWLNDGSWTLTGETFAVKDRAASPMLVYERTFAAGQITLGGNRAGGAQGARSNYVVVARVPGAAGLEGDGLHYVAGPLSADEWLNAGDTDGDGLLDDFENYIGLDPAMQDTDENGTSDESETGPDGQDMWDMQEQWLADQLPGDDVPGDTPGDTPGDDVPDDGDYGDDVPGGGGGGGGGCFLGTAKIERKPILGSVTR